MTIKYNYIKKKGKNKSMEKIDPFIEFPFLDQTIKEYPEEWRLMFPIPGLIDIIPNTYYISSYGRVITKLKTRENSFAEMTIQKNKSNYNRYILNGIENKINSYRNSKLVACYFTPIDYTNPLFYLDKYADNIDGDEDNNHWSNLEWIDTKDVSLLKGGKVAMKQFMLDDFNKMVEKKRSRIRESTIK